MHDGIPGDVLVRIRAKDNTDGWVVSFAPLHLIVHTDINIHLPYITVGNLFGLQIDQHKALQNVVVKHQIDIVILLFGVNVLLSCDKGIALSKLHQELLEIGKDSQSASSAE